MKGKKMYFHHRGHRVSLVLLMKNAYDHVYHCFLLNCRFRYQISLFTSDLFSLRPSKTSDEENLHHYIFKQDVCSEFSFLNLLIHYTFDS